MKKATNPESSDVIVSSGSYSYTAPDGTVISLTYAADDEGGFQPKVSVLDWIVFYGKVVLAFVCISYIIFFYDLKGDHLPTPPPIPPGTI